MAEEKILIADDDPAVRRLLIRVVEGSGFQAVTALSLIHICSALCGKKTVFFQLPCRCHSQRGRDRAYDS